MLEWDEEEAPDSYTGFLGYCSDEDDLLLLGAELSLIQDFDWRGYREKADDEPCTLKVVWDGTPETIQFDPEEPLPNFLDKMPTIQTYIIRAEGAAGPGSGPGYAFFIADGSSRDEVRASIFALRKALDADLKRLSGSR